MYTVRYVSPHTKQQVKARLHGWEELERFIRGWQGIGTQVMVADHDRAILQPVFITTGLAEPALQKLRANPHNVLLLAPPEKVEPKPQPKWWEIVR